MTDLDDVTQVGRKDNGSSIFSICHRLSICRRVSESLSPSYNKPPRSLHSHPNPFVLHRQRVQNWTVHRLTVNLLAAAVAVAVAAVS